MFAEQREKGKQSLGHLHQPAWLGCELGGQPEKLNWGPECEAAPHRHTPPPPPHPPGGEGPGHVENLSPTDRKEERPVYLCLPDFTSADVFTPIPSPLLEASMV